MTLALIRRRPAAAWAGLALAALYLTAGWAQQQRATELARKLAQDRGHAVERLLVKPTLGNLVLWRSIYESDGAFYVDALRLGLTGSRVYPGGVAAAADARRDLADLPADSTLMRDVLRFGAFSDGFTIWHPQRGDVLGDVRYSMSPTGLIPLWGVALDRTRPETHVRYLFFRDMPDGGREDFLRMLAGRDTANTAGPSE